MFCPLYISAEFLIRIQRGRMLAILKKSKAESRIKKLKVQYGHHNESWKIISNEDNSHRITCVESKEIHTSIT